MNNLTQRHEFFFNNYNVLKRKENQRFFLFNEIKLYAIKHHNKYRFFVPLCF